jgi:hypothetical protein
MYFPLPVKRRPLVLLYIAEGARNHLEIDHRKYLGSSFEQIDMGRMAMYINGPTILAWEMTLTSHY